MRAWWSEYGNYVLGGIVVGVGLMVGIGQYRSQTANTQIEASVLYEAVYEAVAADKTDEAETAAADLYANYESTAYPSQARLVMARYYMDKSRDQDAADALRAIVDSDPDSEMGLVARLRLAKVLLYQNKAQEVVDLLSAAPESALSPRYNEVLGDAYVSLGEFADARDAYFLAMADSATMPTVDRVLVQMKVDDLPDIVREDAVQEDLIEGSAAVPDADEQAVDDGEETSE